MNIGSEISFVDCVLITCVSWGMNEIVVKIPANIPNVSLKSIFKPLYLSFLKNNNISSIV